MPFEHVKNGVGNIEVLKLARNRSLRVLVSKGVHFWNFLEVKVKLM